VDYGFQVVANTTDAESQMSEGYVYSSTPCQLHAIVDFQALYIAGHVDDDIHFYTVVGNPNEELTCDGYEATFFIYAKGTKYESREFPKSLHHYWPINCDPKGNKKIDSVPYAFSIGYPFTMLTEGENVFIVGLDPQNPELRFGTVFKDDDDFGYEIICAFDKVINTSEVTAQEWRTLDYVDFIPCSYDTEAFVKIHIVGTDAPMP
jgi:hypothetical protein